ncbi:MAG: putative two-component system sensor kinase [Frankiales bacterium]|nr:putative two-component system sensor kinase [Frankiales bacterium]
MTPYTHRLRLIGPPLVASCGAVAEAVIGDIRPVPVTAILGALAGLALVGRFRYPTAAGLLAVGLNALEGPFGVDMSKPVLPVLVLGIATYGFGQRLELRRALLTCTITVLFIGTSSGLDPAGVTGSNTLFGAVLVYGSFAMGRLLRTRTRALEAAAVASREAAVAHERVRIARELHDLIAHSLSVMVVQAAAAEQVVRSDPERAVASTRAVQQVGRDALGEVARLLDLLRDGPDESSPQPGLADLSDLARDVPLLELAVSVADELPPLPPGAEVSVYRVVEEALANVVKHSTAAAASIRVAGDDGRVVVEVCDEGPARRGTALPGGHGVLGMEERVHMYGGRLSVGPDGRGGWQVRAVFPTAATR